MHHIFLKLSNIFVYLFFLSSNIYTVLGPNSKDSYLDKDHLHQSFLTPAPFAFAIWGFIHLLLGGFVVYQFFPKLHDEQTIDFLVYDQDVGITMDELLFRAVGTAFVIAALLNSFWFMLWESDHLFLAAIMMLLVYATISYIYVNIEKSFVTATWLDEVFVHVPFSLWHVWSLIVFVITLFAAFAPLQQGDVSVPPSAGMTILVTLALLFLAMTGIGYAEYTSKYRRLHSLLPFRRLPLDIADGGDILGAWVISWFFFAVATQQTAPVIRTVSLTLGVILLLYSAKPLISHLANTPPYRRFGTLLRSDDRDQAEQDGPSEPANTHPFHPTRRDLASEPPEERINIPVK